MKSEKMSQSYDIEKGSKYNVGDPKPGQPDILWTDLGNGKFDWKSKNGKWWKGKSTPTASTAQSQPKQTDNATSKTGDNKTLEVKDIKSLTPDKLVEYAKNASTDKLEKVVNDKNADKSLRQIAFNELKGRDDYDKTKVDSKDLAGGYISKPTPKIQYKTKKPEVEVDSDGFKDYEVPTPQGRKKVVISTFRKFLTTKTDDDLLKLLNNTAPMADAIKRHLAYEEAASRGIPEDKIDVRGSLEKLWKKYKAEHDLKEYSNREFNEDEALPLSYDWKGLDHETIMHDVFDDGNDTAWLDSDSPLVRKAFKLETLAGRQKYDTFKDYYQRDPNLVPGYLTAKNKVNELNGQMWDWAQNPDSPLFISAGGAGAGKTYGWREVVADDLSLPELKSGEDPHNTDWGWVMLTDANAEDEKTFAETLSKYNGTFKGSDGTEYPHILFFDDADKLLTTTAKALVSMMKKINDSDPDNRVFTNSKGESEIWRGKIIITTNKNISKLAESEDTRAVLSRATKSDIHFTRNETMELLSERYLTMPLKRTRGLLNSLKFTDEEETDLRQDVFDFMQDHVTDADPNKFTPRAFEDIIENIAKKWKNGSKARKTGKGTIGTDVPWRISALSLLKAENNDIEKADYDEELYSKQAMIDRKNNLEKIMKRAKKEGKFEKLFGQDAQNIILFGESEEKNKDKESSQKTAKKKADKKVDDKKSKNTEKGFDNEMSLDEAESILFG